MYRNHFGLSSPPFSPPLSPTPAHLNRGQREAHDHLRHGISARAGFSKLSGEAHTGKSILLRALLSGLDSTRYVAAHITEPSLKGAHLLRHINSGFGLLATVDSPQKLLKDFERFLQTLGAENKRAVLAVDDAHLMEPAELEEIRLLANLEDGQGEGLHIIFSGRDKLNETLERSELRQLQQRISIRANVGHMSRADSDDHIGNRLEHAGGRSEHIITASALSRIFAYTLGNPRMVDILCDRALTIAFFMGKKRITPAIVDNAVRELLKR